MTGTTESRERSSGYAERFDYRVDILRRRNLVTASLSGQELARSERALIVDEQNHGVVFYFPRSDVRLDRLVSVPEHSTYCPYKGKASYWRLADSPGDPIAWSYEQPYAEVAQIAGHIAFYQNRVTVSVGVAAAVFDVQKGAGAR